MFYFGMMGAFTTLLGFLTGIYVIIEWLNHIEHIPLTILTVLLIVVGIEIFMFGMISDMLLVFHREIIREIQLLQPPKPPK
jgi:dolichol-phosphate mannosyltransferase